MKQDQVQVPRPAVVFHNPRPGTAIYKYSVLMLIQMTVKI